jgi:hypothetical protein
MNDDPHDYGVQIPDPAKDAGAFMRFLIDIMDRNRIAAFRRAFRMHGDQYGSKIVAQNLTKGASEKMTIIHYAIRNKRSYEIIEMLAKYFKRPARPEPPKNTPAAIEKYEKQMEEYTKIRDEYYKLTTTGPTVNLDAAALFISNEESDRIEKEVVPEVKDAIENDNPSKLEELLRTNPFVYNETRANIYFGDANDIIYYALNNNVSAAVLRVLLKYAAAYKIDTNKGKLFELALKEKAPKEILNVLEPAAAVNTAALSGTIAHEPAALAAPAALTRYLSSLDISEVRGLKVMKLLKGTLLFNAFKVQSPEEIAAAAKAKNIDTLFSANNHYLQLLNGILPLSTTITHDDKTIKIKGCIDKNSAKFFYANPVGGPALGSVHGTFNTFAAFELKHDINVVVLMSPASQHRLNSDVDHEYIDSCLGFAQSYHTKDPSAYCRCSYDPDLGEDHECPYANKYDVCIEPSFLKNRDIHGHIAIAEADSYSHKMYEFDTKFANNANIPTKYKKLNELIFKACVSEDRRYIESAAGSVAKPVIGFPEIVLQLYGPKWYKNDVHEQRFEQEIPIEDGDVAKTIIKYLLNVDTSKLFPNADNPLQLKYIATTRALYNFTNGTVMLNPLRTQAIIGELYSNFATYYYLNYLEAYMRGDINFFVDPRTGFLMNGSLAPTNILINTNDYHEEKYKRIKLEEYLSKIKGDGSLLEKSAQFRMRGRVPGLSHLSYPKTFIPAFIVDFENENSGSSGSSKSGSSGGGITHRSRIPKTQKRKKVAALAAKAQETRQKFHKTLRRIMKPTIRSRVASVKPRPFSPFMTPLWVDQAYMQIMKIIREQRS